MNNAINTVLDELYLVSNMGKNEENGDNKESIKVNKIWNESVNICFCTSDQYAPYCGIAIQSIIETSSDCNNYDIFIMEYDISDDNKIKIISLLKDRKNFSVRFINMSKVLDLLKVNTWAHFSVVNCFKLFLMTDSFSDYEKILALDTDIVFLRDAADLYNINIADNILAAVDDVIMKEHIHSKVLSGGFAPIMPIEQYISEYLNFGSSDRYYNTGVSILNLNQCRLKGVMSKALHLLKTKGYIYQEQDVLNELCAKNIYDLELNWNVFGTECSDEVISALPQVFAEKYNNALKNPYILHFAGGRKPWNDPNMPFADKYYKYARNTPWYEKIMENIERNSTPHLDFMSKVKKLFPEDTLRYKAMKKVLPRDRGIRRLISISRFRVKTLINKVKVINIHDKIVKYHQAGTYKRYLHKQMMEEWVLLDSKNGTDLAGNIFRILEELHNAPEYSNLKKYLTYENSSLPRIVAILRRYNLKNIQLVKWKSDQYFEALARSKYIVTDLYIPFEYVKREGQILISTAHGTPLKMMGRDCHTETQGHLQKTHTLADYQTFSSDYMKEKLCHAFMEDYLSTGHLLKSGYARNTVFFNSDRREEVRKELGFGGKRVYAYLPTFRGIAGSFESQEQINSINQYCQKLDMMMQDDELLLVKLHNFNKESMDFTDAKHIAVFPSDYEVYDVLNATDVLISDYSSVIFDYANSRRKIVLFQYDFEQYTSIRGLYLRFDEMPFPIVRDVETLYKEISTPRNYDDNEFIRRFCTYDKKDSTKQICRTIWGNDNKCPEYEHKAKTKKNILIYGGPYDLRVPATFYTFEYIKRFDMEKYNIILYYYEYDLFAKAYILNEMPEKMNYLSFLSHPDYTVLERICAKTKTGYNILTRTYKREFQKNLANYPIDVYIDLFGFNIEAARIGENIKGKKIILYEKDAGLKIQDYKKYDVILTFDREVSEVLQNNKVVILEKGYSPSICDNNASIIEKLFD